MKKTCSLFVATFVTSILLSTFAKANEFEAEIIAYMNESISGWAQSADILNAVKEQNDAHASISDEDIKSLDEKWRAEATQGNGELIDSVLRNPLSQYLKDIKNQSNGAITEIFIFDKKGLNVGQSDVTSDYFQGDEAKWEKTVNTAGATYHLSEVEFDESTQSYQSNLSVTILDGSTPIGAMTIGLNVENLM